LSTEERVDRSDASNLDVRWFFTLTAPKQMTAITYTDEQRVVTVCYPF